MGLLRVLCAALVLWERAAAAAGFFNCSALLPPRTSVREDGCCLVEPTDGAPGKIRGAATMCSAEATPHGRCARSLNYPKPTPPGYHLADEHCDENDPNAPFLTPCMACTTCSTRSTAPSQCGFNQPAAATCPRPCPAVIRAARQPAMWAGSHVDGARPVLDFAYARTSLAPLSFARLHPLRLAASAFALPLPLPLPLLLPRTHTHALSLAILRTRALSRSLSLSLSLSLARARFLSLAMSATHSLSLSHSRTLAHRAFSLAMSRSFSCARSRERACDNVVRDTNSSWHAAWCCSGRPGEAIKGIVYGHFVSRDLVYVHFTLRSSSVVNNRPR